MKTKLISNLLEKKIKVSFLGCCVASVLCMPLHTNATQGIVSPDGYTDLSNNSVKDVEDDFVLNSKSWLNIKLYVENSLKLPITENAIRNKFAIPTQENFAEYQDLLDTYQDLHNTADSWNRTVYPDIISHAHDLKNYALLRHQFLEPITQRLETFVQTQSEEDRDKALAFLTALQTYTEGSRDKASKSLQQLTDFNADLQKHIGQLDSLSDKFSELSLLGTQQLEQDLVRFHRTRSKLNDEYHNHVTIAATTPTYAWYPILGWIAAPIVAGVYTDKAIKVKAHIKELDQDIKSTNEQIKYKKKVFISYKNAYLSLTEANKDASVAKSKVEQLHIAWMSLHADLEQAVTLLKGASGENGIQHAAIETAGLLAQLQFEQSRETWRSISNQASKFANHAYTIN